MYFRYTKRHVQYQGIPQWSMYVQTQKILVAGAVQEEVQSYPSHRLYGQRWSGRRLAELKTTLVGSMYTKKTYLKLNTKYWL